MKKQRIAHRKALSHGGPPAGGAVPPLSAASSGEGGGEGLLLIEELEPRLTPDYWGSSWAGGGRSSDSRTVGWGC
jgi:hypothetical protein